jgi:uroporphyrinogen decarboxylase
MKSKERVLTALDHKEPDKVPRFSTFTPEFASRLRQHLGIGKASYEFLGVPRPDLELKLGSDLLLTGQGWANSYYKSLDESYTDDWGIGWRQVEYNTGLGKGKYTEISSRPLDDDGAINSYNPPDPTVEDKYDSSKELIDNYGKYHAIVGVIVCTIFETAWALRGLEKLLMDLVLNEDLANKILDLPFNYHLYAGKKLVELGVDLIWTGDDMGGQNEMVISPQLWRKYFKPRMARLYSELRSINSGVMIAYHSDGYVYPIIDDLVEIGLDVLNPLQPKSMDPYYLKKRYGKKLSLWGSIDIQQTLPFGTVKDVEDEVRDRIKNMAPGGGFIISPTHHIQIDTPVENFMAFWNASEKYGRYPITDL